MSKSMKIAVAGAFVSGAVLTVCMAVAMPPSGESMNEAAVGIPTPAPTVNEDPSDWRDGYLPCETPTGSTMTAGCFWDLDGEHYVVTDDGERFDVDVATGERTYVEPVNEDPWLTAPDGTEHFEDGSWRDPDGTQGCTPGMPCDQAVTPAPAVESTNEPAARRTVTLNGQTFDYVDGTDAILYCELPLRVGIDTDDKGNEWAGCM